MVSTGMSIEKRIEKARKAVQASVGQHRAIAEALGVHYNWVRKFSSGALVEPGAVKFAKLEAWLAKNGPS
jgi:hypothetical protein